jgi:hypothetical protein
MSIFIDGKQNIVYQKIVDFLIERLELMGEPDHKKSNMIFSILENMLDCWPKIENACTKLPFVYPEYPELLDKLFKYSIDEKDIELREKYCNFLTKMCKRMLPWF